LIFDTQFVLEHGGFGTPVAINSFFNQNPIPGTGPYMVTKVAEDSSVQFIQNPTYWGRNLTQAQIQANPYMDPGHVKNVIIQAKTDDVSRYVDLSTGQAQVAAIQTQDWPLVLANPDKYSYFSIPNNSMVFVAIAMNTHRYPTNITAVRQAIVHAVNYSDVAAKAFFGELAPMVGPEYPAQQQYYDLGNLPPYQFNDTLAEQILSNASINPASLPTIEFRVLTGCSSCISAAQVVQSDLSAIGISVNVEVTPSSSFSLPLVGGGSFASNLQSAQSIAQLSWFGSLTWAPDEPTPADAWLLFVNNQSTAGDYAIYSNIPAVQPCVNAWTDGSSASTLQSLCTTAQAQVYHDAPYIWLGTVKLMFGAGSVVWQKSVVKSLLVDPDYTGQAYTIFNTVQFVSG
jgi:ABC-type transport system substrate-binding protein